jgi:hypothetical protein
MNTKRILDKVQHKLQDASYSREELLNDLNDLLTFIAAVFPLPELQATETLTVGGDGSTEDDLPNNYLSNLYRVENLTTGRACKVVFNYKVLAEMHDGLTVEGDIQDVTAENGVLFFRKSPAAAQDLKLFFNEKPDVLVDEVGSVPTCIPTHLHQPLLTSYLLFDKFSEIEDGPDGHKPNTTFYWQRYTSAMADLAAFYPNVSRQNVYQRFSTLTDPLRERFSQTQTPVTPPDGR